MLNRQTTAKRDNKSKELKGYVELLDGSETGR